LHLKRLELQGFKSFANPTELELEPGITAVVGPNGSGKSNLAEAVRWVLGEQSARQLRGSRMEDVIFHGSDRRRAVGMAEVAVTFDNTDGRLPLEFAEITLSRRVYRAGEGEYLLNRAPVRLKDVQDLLAHTGLGRDGYAIMEQGRVEEILRARPEERRALFEEAAGITRHRQRKREALKKLEETTQSLARVADVIAELRNQLEPLEEQAAAARTYLAYRDEHRRLAEGLRARKLSRLSRQWQVLGERRAALLAERDALKHTLASGEHELADLRRRLQESERALASREALQQDLVARRQAAAGYRLVAAERSRALADEASRLEEELASTQRRQEEAQARLVLLQTEGEELDRRVVALREELESLKTAAAVDGARAQGDLARLEELKATLIELLNRIGEARHGLARAEEEAVRLEASLQRLGQRVQTLAAEEERVRSTLAGTETAASGLAERLQAARAALAEVRRLLPASAEAARLAREDLAGLREELAGLRARLATLQEMRRTGEGLPPGARFLLEGDPAGLIGPLADVVEALPEHRPALEAALEQYAGCLLVRREELPELISRLRHGNRGRATLWPVPPDGLPPDPPAGVRTALELVHDGPHEVLGHLLARVLLATDLEEALVMAAAHNWRYCVVTLDGELVHPGGGIAAGQSTGAAAGLGLGRELARLERQLAEREAAERRAADLLGRREEERAGLQAREAALREEVGRLEAEARAHEGERLGLETRKRRLDEERAALAAERERLTQEMASAHAAIQAHRRELEELVRQRQSLEAEASRLEAACRQEREMEVQRSERLTELKVDLARAEQRQLHLTQALDEARRALGQLAATAAARGRRLAEVRAEQEARAEEAEARASEVERLAADLGSGQAELDRKREERAALLQLVASREESLRALREQSERVQARLHELEIRAARVEVEYGNLAGPSPPPEEAGDLGGLSEEAAAARVLELEALMAAMGTVNLGAIAECERLGERCRFLERERDDLEEARRGLDRLLAEIDQVMAERFLQGFGAIREAFTVIFGELFGGGRGELELEDPDDPLETGVEIRAQPPGKRLQSLSLLSAGERALVAIALLFAILTVQPAPFCILDEIDAPLDDANVVKFARMLRQHAASTQFLVVTHNKGTMEVADALYGVTMEEGGVSRLVSLRLAEAAGTGGE